MCVAGAMLPPAQLPPWGKSFKKYFCKKRKARKQVRRNEFYFISEPCFPAFQSEKNGVF